LSRCICMPNIKSLSVMAQKLWPMLKLSSNRRTDGQTDRQTDKQTNRQGKNNMPPRSYLGGIKTVNFIVSFQMLADIFMYIISTINQFECKMWPNILWDLIWIQIVCKNVPLAGKDLTLSIGKQLWPG